MNVIIPLVIFICALSTIIVIIARKWSQIVLFDVESLPEVKEAEKKDEFLRKRAEQSAEKTYQLAAVFFRPVFKSFRFIQLAFRKYVGKIERAVMESSYKKSQIKKMSVSLDIEQELRTLIQEGRYALKEGDFNNAEKKFITAIKIHDRSVEAYEGLADVYYKQAQLEEAKQTYRFVLYLDRDNEHALLRLAEIAEEEGKLETAVDYYQQVVLINENIAVRFTKLYELLLALKQYDTALAAIEQAVNLEPQNPKYLDNFIEASILVGNKKLAEEGWQQLRMVNPENQKLSIFKERIAELHP